MRTVYKDQRTKHDDNMGLLLNRTFVNIITIATFLLQSHGVEVDDTRVIPLCYCTIESFGGRPPWTIHEAVGLSIPWIGTEGFTRHCSCSRNTEQDVRKVKINLRCEL